MDIFDQFKRLELVVELLIEETELMRKLLFAGIVMSLLFASTFVAQQQIQITVASLQPVGSGQAVGFA